jgi:hypothetical protein
VNIIKARFRDASLPNLAALYDQKLYDELPDTVRSAGLTDERKKYLSEQMTQHIRNPDKREVLFNYQMDNGGIFATV